jgi:UDP-N-acetyl-D-galactosamine dehydrogenase
MFTKPVDIKIAVVGLGYVGLPLATAFASKFHVEGFDIKQTRVDEINQAFDSTLEVDSEQLSAVLALGNDAIGLHCSSSVDNIRQCNVYIVSVPTPTDQHNRPDLGILLAATQTIGSVLKPADVVIYESTVYPGVTEDICVPVLERVSGLKFNHDFYGGYSPERINPGDKMHTITNILKVTSGSTPEVADFIDDLYRAIVTAGTHKAPSIKVAEACKVIENSQRDINIAFVNELSKIFTLLGIDSHDVLAAAGTKWNFLNFKPGLVGGHCTGVDPYYLAQKAQEMGYHPEIILAGRRLNDGMGKYVALEVIKLMIKRNINVKNANVLVLGFTFKENCTDVRNTRVIDIVNVLHEFDANYEVFDPWANPAEVLIEYGIKTNKNLKMLKDRYDAVILAVGHNEFKALDIEQLKRFKDSVVYDIKGVLDRSIVDGRL